MAQKNNTPQTPALRKTAVRCSTCGRFMRRLGIITQVRLEVECGMIRTHWCSKEEITFATGEYVHN